MMEKMRTLFNVVVLFVLVLFGSVVPASAQDGSGMEDWQIVFAILIPLAGLMFTLYHWQNKRNDDAHKNIGDNIKNVDAKVEKVDKKVDETNIFLRNCYAAEASRRGRPSENAQD